MNSILKTYPNLDNRKSWTITAEVKLPKHIILRFIPDKLIADHEGLIKILESHASDNEHKPEEIILRIIEIVNNELIPKWLEVSYEHKGIMVKVEDQQPGR